MTSEKSALCALGSRPLTRISAVLAYARYQEFSPMQETPHLEAAYSGCASKKENSMSRKILAGGAAILAVAGMCGLAAAGEALHSMTVKSPDGGTVTVRYTGNVAPKIAFAPPAQVVSGAPMQSPFAMMERIAAQMDRQMEAMMQQSNALMARLPDANPTVPAGFWNMPMSPPGLSAIAAGGKGSFCMKSMEITSTGDGKSHVVTHTAGNCGGDASPSAAPSHAVQGTGPRTPI
jgi:hypothetical protein